MHRKEKKKKKDGDFAMCRCGRNLEFNCLHDIDFLTSTPHTQKVPVSSVLQMHSPDWSEPVVCRDRSSLGPHSSAMFNDLYLGTFLSSSKGLSSSSNLMPHGKNLGEPHDAGVARLQPT
jgi:hypothetical protein